MAPPPFRGVMDATRLGGWCHDTPLFLTLPARPGGCGNEVNESETELRCHDL